MSQDDVKEAKGFIARRESIYNLSVKINQIILDFERENNVTIVCNSQMSEHYPEAYPNEPKVLLFAKY